MEIAVLNQATQPSWMSYVPLPVTTLAGNNQSYTAPASVVAQEIVMNGNGDSATSNASTLLIVANGAGDSATTSSANVAFVANGSADSLTLTGHGETATVDLTHEPTGAAAAMQIVSSLNLIDVSTVLTPVCSLPGYGSGQGCGSGSGQWGSQYGGGSEYGGGSQYGWGGLYGGGGAYYGYSIQSYCGASGTAQLDVTGDHNKIVLGSYSIGLTVTGHLNLVVGGSASSTVTFSTNAAAANVVVGGAGAMVVTSSAAVTDVIGGSGSMTLAIDGPAANIVGGSGFLSGTIHSDGGVLQTGSGTANVTITGYGVEVATGSGAGVISYGDGTSNSAGGILYKANASGFETFNVRANGSTIYGGDVINAYGFGIVVAGRAQFLTDAGGSIAAQFQGAGNGVYASLLPDPDLTAALLAANPFALPPGLASTGGSGSGPSQLGGGYGSSQSWGWGGSWGCGSGGQRPPPARTINFNVTGGSVYSDSVTMSVTVNGSNDSLYGGTVGQSYVIQTGHNNSIWAGAGNNVYTGDGQANVLEYYKAPGQVYVNFAQGFAQNGYGGVDTISNLYWAEAGSNSTLVGGAHDAILTAIGSGATLVGGSGNDVLTARGSGNHLFAGSGNDTLHATGIDSDFEVGGAGAIPASTIITQDYAGVTGSLTFLAGTPASKLWFTQDAAGDLVIDVLGTTKSVTVQTWFAPGGSQLANVFAGSAALTNAGVNAVEAAMASYQSSHAGFNPSTATALPTDAGIAAAYAANWH